MLAFPAAATAVAAMTFCTAPRALCFSVGITTVVAPLQQLMAPALLLLLQVSPVFGGVLIHCEQPELEPLHPHQRNAGRAAGHLAHVSSSWWINYSQQVLLCSCGAVVADVGARRSLQCCPLQCCPLVLQRCESPSAAVLLKPTRQPIHCSAGAAQQVYTCVVLC